MDALELKRIMPCYLLIYYAKYLGWIPVAREQVLLSFSSVITFMIWNDIRTISSYIKRKFIHKKLNIAMQLCLRWQTNKSMNLHVACIAFLCVPLGCYGLFDAYLMHFSWSLN